ncbi:damage-inducible protein CinA [Herbaspirillum rubrisubalbicans]|jgi:nicotinamide-nucleotide amidase|uniref:CinA family protein n=2 Tax=Herbaspirillum rubrisubalbicans TaxID=80842 RepID=A0AAD0UBU5_9BURK|nr:MULTISPECIES: CinA family protein [Herbaspirillum]ALU90545.1 competence- and mitomycin-induced protein [Herbaspirillum rubrisubalbicans M1]AYR25572.1 CinA family protein [Herbaspirillum rubrisubalbicans]MCP1573817.1 nicotinamide-nucleotide amidase [Herbaspirillum rubrisubalbicans]NQE48106.1 damage-inducible protein CinA [Herbaspirillum rubrisubalbicans]QJQ02275.1 CinA family protein [Herbaspirillum rubrisubalbicans Os34]
MDSTLDLATRVGHTLKSKGLLLATAESCTGGGIAHAITEIAGSSEWFDCGFVTYSNASKNELLDISEALIAQHGAVSEEIAGAMAEGAVANSNSDVAVSTTGIAGPGGAVPGKPVGTVCFGWRVGEKTYTERLVFKGDRQQVRAQTVEHSLKGLLKLLAD